MAWLILACSGALEIAWASLLPRTDGFSRPLPTLALLLLLAASMFGMALATRTIPIGTAYAVWTGIGAAGAAVVGILVYHEPVSTLRVGFIVLLLAAVLGLRLTDSSAS